MRRGERSCRIVVWDQSPSISELSPMSLLGLFDRPLNLHLPGRGLRLPTSPPPRYPARARLEPPAVSTLPAAANLEVARFLTTTLLADISIVRDAVADLEASVDERVVVWSPAMYTTSRTALVSGLLEGDDALSDVHVSIDGEGFGGSTTFVLWSLTARFDRAGLLNDDVLIEPSYRSIESAGVLVLSFDGSRAARIDCFYDGVALLEQVLSGAAPAAADESITRDGG
jgi:hypothetical protein